MLHLFCTGLSKQIAASQLISTGINEFSDVVGVSAKAHTLENRATLRIRSNPAYFSTFGVSTLCVLSNFVITGKFTYFPTHFPSINNKVANLLRGGRLDGSSAAGPAAPLRDLITATQ